MTTITIPDFEFSGVYYPELLEDLIQWKRVNVPEIADESEEEPFIQLLMAYALVGHICNVTADLIAKEGYLSTAQLRASVKALLQLIDYDLAQPSPASADLVMVLSGGFIIASQITVVGSRFTTTALADSPAIDFEDLNGLIADRTDELYKVFSFASLSGSWTDETTAANTPGSPWSPTFSPTTKAGDILYLSHRNVFWDRMQFLITVAASGITGVWEYYDGNLETHEPNSVTNLGSYLRLNINTLLGSTNASGATVRVKCNLTGAYEDVVSQWDTQNYILTTAFLGQASPSTDEEDYTIGTAWRIPDNIDDGTVGFTLTGTYDIDFDFPQTLLNNWRSTEVNGYSAYWMRWRVISVSTPSDPTFDIIDIDKRNLYCVNEVTQGISRIDDPLGSSTGLPNQTFTFFNYPVIDDTSIEITVDESGTPYVWTRVDNFLTSAYTDRHYTVDFDDDGQAIITFGNGVNGKIPPAGTDNIKAEYRTMEDEDGNVGALTINQNQSGSAFISSVYNPRSATGYQPEEGYDEADLKRAKNAGSASVRIGETASSAEEIEAFTIAYQDPTDGSRPFSRALIIEEGYGPKTAEIVVVGSGGQLATTSQLEALENYFNGDGVERGILLINHEVVAENWQPKNISVVGTVYGGNLTSIETVLTAFLHPEAQDDEGDWQWEFGGEVPISRIIAEIFNSSPTPRKVTLTSPSTDIQLAQKELPLVTVISLTIVP